MNDSVSALQAVYFALTLVALVLSIIAVFCPRRGPQGRQGLPGKDAKPAEVHISIDVDISAVDETMRALDRLRIRKQVQSLTSAGSNPIYAGMRR